MQKMLSNLWDKFASNKLWVAFCFHTLQFYRAVNAQFYVKIRYLNHLFIKRSHIIIIKTKSPNHDCWMDTDEKIFIACFELLKEYVIKELDTIRGDYKYKGFYVNDSITDKKAIDLYLWYVEDLPKMSYSYEDEKIRDDKLDELMKIRKSLWT